MKRSALFITVLSLLVMLSPTFAADAPAPVVDVVTLKDGSVIYGEVVEMTGGSCRSRAPRLEISLRSSGPR